ncbi:cation channel sperm-associated protein 2-like [Triplophysa dalaica]|uniref:cation channel sperm-associated protein 2-like n=1 Tax=Triplophysa dalaica TaxID=1582913 RepID=UPI0024DFBC17|nr:cation channel sperm-associated protein 2-like [Triplophysa dalaica]
MNRRETTQLLQLKTIKAFKYKLQLEKNVKFTIGDVTDEQLNQSLGAGDNLVKFTFKRLTSIKPQQRITNRVFNRYAKYPLFNMLPRQILESRAFNVLIICCVVLSTVLVVLETESQDNEDQTLDTVQQYTNRCILAIFTLEVLIKWLEDFCKFWNMWNMFDLAVTAMYLFRHKSAHVQ